MKKFDFLKSRRFHQGGIAVVLTASIIAIIILFNTLFGILASRFNWNLDLSGGYFFTLTDYSKKLLKQTFEEMPENRKKQNERYEKKNEELIQSVNDKIDELLSESGNVSVSHLDRDTYSSEAVSRLNLEIEKVNKEKGTDIEGFVYRALIEPAPENSKLKIIFCDDEDDVESSELHMYVLETARQLRAEFPDVIEIEFINIYANPSAVNKYKTSTLTTISSTDVIVESGNEYRHFTLDSFYIFESSSSSTVWAYNGEKKFASAILAVTQAEAPIAGVLLNHGETFYDDSLLTLLQDAGFIVEGLDLSKDEIPDDCRLILCYNPDKDFLSSADVGEGERSEITVLEDFLKRDNTSFMVFVSPATPILKNLEEFLSLWGVTFDRTALDSGEIVSNMIKESSENSVTADGFSNIGKYVTAQLGGELTSDMRNALSPAKVIFRNAMSISYAENYNLDRGTDDVSGTDDDTYSAAIDGRSRFIYNVFTSSANASAVANGTEVGKATSADPYIYMTLTEERKGYGETVFTPDGLEFEGQNTTKTSSYVVTFSSVEFATEQYLDSASYGNSELLLRTLHEMGKDAIPTLIPIKPFEKSEIETMNTKTANVWTAVLAIVPAIGALGTGIYVLVRRKNK